MVQAFLSSRVMTPQGMRPAAVLVERGTITAVVRPQETPQGAVIRDFDDLVILPGLVDTHVHINEPGRTEWEGFATATRAAAAAGITTLVDMPLNCLPPTITVEALQEKRAAASGKCYVDWAAWGGVADNNIAHIEELAAAGVKGYKSFLVDPGIEGLEMLTEAGLKQAAPILARTGLPLLVHAEHPRPITEAAASFQSQDGREYAPYLRSRPDEAELEAIRLLIRTARKHGTRIHIVHLATGAALEMLTAARAEGLPITVETCPHYVYFAAETIARGETLKKCAPPIRSKKNREGLWQGLTHGVIDLIATDHSPCPPAMKQAGEGDFGKAWGGIASLSLSPSIVWTGMREREIKLEHLARWMSLAPARLAGLDHRKGSIEPGKDADLAIFDPEASFVVAEKYLRYRHPISPYLGERLHGVVVQTFVRGEQVTEEAPPHGIEV